MERRAQRVVDEPVLIDERQALEAWAGDRDVEMVTRPCSIDNRELGRVRERSPQQLLESLHALSVAASPDPTVGI